MIEIMRTTNPVDVNYIEALLKDADIFVAVFDANISVVEGSIGLFPKRVMISEEDRDEAREVLRGTELEEFLLPHFIKG